MSGSRRASAALFVAALLAVTACGSDADSTGDSGADSTAVTAETTDDTTTPTPEPAGSDPAADDTVGESAFPVTIEHQFGETTIDAEPQRVVSVGFNEHDFLLALGVVPVGVRDWYGDQPFATWPWAQDELGDAQPEVIPSAELNFEQIAALDPDLIVGVWSGMTGADYEKLSAIAPTVAQSDEYDEYGTPWQEQTLVLGEATGRLAQAEAIVAALDARYADIRAAHPDWEGQTASVSFVTEEGPGAYASQDPRSRFMQDLGFVIPEVNDTDPTNSFYLQLSAEDISALDVDALVWVYSTPEEIDGILTRLPTRANLTANAEGREIFADVELSAAFSHSSPLSLEYVLDRMVPELEAAADGDPSTPVPSAVAVGAVDGTVTDGSEGGDDAAAAAGAAWALVFDSTATFDDKSAHLEDADALRATIDAYATAGSGFGGITLAPTDVVVTEPTATVTYDVNFGPNPAYTDQTGEISLVDGVWVVSRDEFCSFMASARVPCP